MFGVQNYSMTSQIYNQILSFWKMLIDISDGSRISSRWGREPSGGGGAWTHNFAKFSQKLHEIERIWTPGGGGRGVRPSPPLDPPQDIETQITKFYSFKRFGGQFKWHVSKDSLK